MTDSKIYNDSNMDSVYQLRRETIPSVLNITTFSVQPKGSIVYDISTQKIYYSNGLVWNSIDDTTPIHLDIDVTSNTIIPFGDTVIRWPNVREDTHNIYNPTSGIITIPKSGLWNISVKILIDQAAAGSGQPAAFYQHILTLVKNTPWPDGNTILFADVFQERFLVPQLPKQVPLQWSGITRVSANDTFTFNIASITFDGGTMLRDTGIGGAFCLNCVTMTRIGD